MYYYVCEEYTDKKNPSYFIVCEEYVGGKSCFTIRANTDCSPVRFKVLADFDSYEEANLYISLITSEQSD